VRFLWSVSEQKQAQATGALDAPGICRGCAALDDLSAIQTGTVKWYDPRKGFGFIRQADGAEVFVHRAALSAIQGRAIRAGQAVRFRLLPSEQGPRAVEVERLEHKDSDDL
jgi:CspA family cold shock protein